MSVTVERCSSLAHAEEIKRLFLRNRLPGFPDFFDRAYSYGAARGGLSWVARNGAGTVIGHVAVLPRFFRGANGCRRGGLLADLLVDEAHRTAWAALELCRRVVLDLRELDAFEFLYTDPTPASHAFLRLLRFTTVGTVRRFVAPLHSLYNAIFGIGLRGEPLCAEPATGLEDGRVADVLDALQGRSYFRAERSIEFYGTRLGGENVPQWEFWLMHPRRPGAPPVGLAVTAPQPARRVLSVLDLVWDEQRTGIPRMLDAVARRARGLGFRKLEMVTLETTKVARVLRRCGFVGREQDLPLDVLRHPRAPALPPSEDWLLTALDGSAW